MRMSIFPRSGAGGLQRLPYVEILYRSEMGRYIHFGTSTRTTRVKTYTVFGPDCRFQNNKMYENDKVDFRAERCQKYALCQKFLQIKIVKDSVWYKKVSGRVCLISPRGEIRGSKDCHLQNIKCTKRA